MRWSASSVAWPRPPGPSRLRERPAGVLAACPLPLPLPLPLPADRRSDRLIGATSIATTCSRWARARSILLGGTAPRPGDTAGSLREAARCRILLVSRGVSTGSDAFGFPNPRKRLRTCSSLRSCAGPEPPARETIFLGAQPPNPVPVTPARKRSGLEGRFCTAQVFGSRGSSVIHASKSLTNFVNRKKTWRKSKQVPTFFCTHPARRVSYRVAGRHFS